MSLLLPRLDAVQEQILVAVSENRATLNPEVSVTFLETMSSGAPANWEFRTNHLVYHAFENLVLMGYITMDVSWDGIDAPALSAAAILYWEEHTIADSSVHTESRVHYFTPSGRFVAPTWDPVWVYTSIPGQASSEIILP